jgi:hypothetical protein
MSKKALVTWGGWEGHQPELASKIAIDLLKKEGYEVTTSTSLDCFLEIEKMKTYDLIVPCWTMSTITKEQEASLLETIKAGCGLAGWHGGMGDAFRNNTGYQFMVGGQWVAHPGNVLDYTVNIVKKDDPIVKGLNDFKMNSEQYFLHVDPSIEVLATTTFTGDHAHWIKGCVMPIAWKKFFDKGRVFYSALGHQAKDLEVPESKEMLRRGMLWATR